MKSTPLLVLLFLSPFLIFVQCIDESRRLCAARDYGKGSIVCVCNQTYCDDLSPITRTDSGTVKVFETSKSGDRFAENEIQFGEPFKICMYSRCLVAEELSSVVQTATINLNSNQTYQKIIGFGGAFTDSAGLNLLTLPKSLQIRAMSDYYSKKGIEYTMGRIPIGGSDFSTRAYTYDDIEGDFGLEHFSLTAEDLDFKIPFILLAQELSPYAIKYYGSPWSSPAWMKTNKKINNGGFLIGEPGNKYYETFANYFVKFLDAYTKRNISLWGLTIENEPNAGFNDKYLWNSLGFSPDLQRDFIKMDLGPTLAKAGYGADKLKLMINDDQRPTVSHWANVILSDSKAANYVSGTAFHWYQNSDANLVELDKAHNAFPDHFLLGTEACEEWVGVKDKVSLGNWQTFNRYAHDIISDLNHWTNGWTDWNLALDLQGGPNWVGNNVDAPIIVNKTSEEYYKQPFFYGLGHFSKFLVPDSERIGSQIKGEGLELLEVTAFRRPDNATVLIVLNRSNESVFLTINDNNYGLAQNLIKGDSLQSYIWFD